MYTTKAPDINTNTPCARALQVPERARRAIRAGGRRRQSVRRRVRSFFFFFSSKPKAIWGRKLLRSNLFASGAQGAYARRARCQLSRPHQPVPGHVYGRIWLTISRDTLGGGQVGRSGRAFLLRSWAVAPAWGWIPRMDAHLLSGEHFSLVRRPAARSCSRAFP